MSIRYNAYFVAAGEIWQDYFDGKISLTIRDGKAALAQR